MYFIKDCMINLKYMKKQTSLINFKLKKIIFYLGKYLMGNRKVLKDTFCLLFLFNPLINYSGVLFIFYLYFKNILFLI